MTSNGLRLEYALEDNSNFIAQKDHMEVVLDDNGLLEYVKTDIAKPQASNAKNLAQWKKGVAKVRRIILEGVQYHIVSNIHGKETPYTMWKTLIDIFKNNSNHKKPAPCFTL